MQLFVLVVSLPYFVFYSLLVMIWVFQGAGPAELLMPPQVRELLWDLHSLKIPYNTTKTALLRFKSAMTTRLK
jgi:hypothetical protein